MVFPLNSVLTDSHIIVCYGQAKSQPASLPAPIRWNCFKMRISFYLIMQLHWCCWFCCVAEWSQQWLTQYLWLGGKRTVLVELLLRHLLVCSYSKQAMKTKISLFHSRLRTRHVFFSLLGLWYNYGYFFLYAFSVQTWHAWLSYCLLTIPCIYLLVWLVFSSSSIYVLHIYTRSILMKPKLRHIGDARMFCVRVYVRMYE